MLVMICRRAEAAGVQENALATPRTLTSASTMQMSFTRKPMFGCWKLLKRMNLGPPTSGFDALNQYETAQHQNKKTPRHFDRTELLVFDYVGHCDYIFYLFQNDASIAPDLAGAMLPLRIFW